MIELVQKEIEQIVSVIVKKHCPEKIYLFGSFAWGKPHQDSDLDFLIVKKNIKSMRQAARKIGESFLGRKIGMDILVCTPDHLAKRLSLGDVFAGEIVKKGKLLYGK